MRLLRGAWKQFVTPRQLGDQEPRIAIGLAVGLAVAVALYVLFLIITGRVPAPAR